MEFKKEWQPPRTEWGVTKVWLIERRGNPAGHRDEHYIPHVYHSRQEAQAICDKHNAGPGGKVGRYEPQSYEREGSWALVGMLPL